MTRKLQVEPRARRRRRAARLMGEEDARGGICGRARQCCYRVAAVRGIEVMRAEIGHPSDDDARAAVGNHDVLVHENAQSEPRNLAYPRPLAGIVLMVAGYEERTVPRAQLAERRGMRCE